MAGARRPTLKPASSPARRHAPACAALLARPAGWLPGVTAAVACAAATGIPLTHRDHARTVTFATGHTRDGRLDLDFAALARPGQTLGVYIGVTTLAALRDGLVAAGLPAGTPAAPVERGGTEAQRVLRGMLTGGVARARVAHRRPRAPAGRRCGRRSRRCAAGGVPARPGRSGAALHTLGRLG